MAIWSGRFRTRLHPDALTFSTSLDIDKRLYREDIEGSIAHVRMLAKQKIISRQEARRIESALRRIQREIQAPHRRTKGTFDPLTNGGVTKDHPDRTDGRFVAEDIHMAIERRLIELTGDTGGKL